jgi:hypothetical protein
MDCVSQPDPAWSRADVEVPIDLVCTHDTSSSGRRLSDGLLQFAGRRVTIVASILQSLGAIGLCTIDRQPQGGRRQVEVTGHSADGFAVLEDQGEGLARELIALPARARGLAALRHSAHCFRVSEGVHETRRSRSSR